MATQTLPSSLPPIAASKRTCKHWYCELTHPALPCSFLVQHAAEAPVKREAVAEEARARPPTALKREPEPDRRFLVPVRGERADQHERQLRQPARAASCEHADVPHAKSSELLQVSQLLPGAVPAQICRQDFSRVRGRRRRDGSNSRRRDHFREALSELEDMLRSPEQPQLVRNNNNNSSSSERELFSVGLQPRTLVDSSKFISDDDDVYQHDDEEEDRVL